MFIDELDMEDPFYAKLYSVMKTQIHFWKALIFAVCIIILVNISHYNFQIQSHCHISELPLNGSIVYLLL